MVAKVLQVRPSVVSRRVRHLEDVIGVSLFHRGSRGLQATIAGKRFLSRGRAILSDLEGLLRTARLSGEAAEGQIRFGLISSIASSFPRDLLSEFARQNPGVAMEVFENSLRENIAGVRSLSLDFAIATGNPFAPDCVVEELWRDKIQVALPASHPLSNTEEITWQQLANERFIISRVDPGSVVRDYIVRGMVELGRHPVVEQLATQRETLLAFVGLGQGLSLVGTAAAGVSYPGVVFRPLDHEKVSFCLIWSEKNDNPAFRRFLALARDLAARRRVAVPSS